MADESPEGVEKDHYARCNELLQCPSPFEPYTLHTLPQLVILRTRVSHPNNGHVRKTNNSVSIPCEHGIDRLIDLSAVRLVDAASIDPNPVGMFDIYSDKGTEVCHFPVSSTVGVILVHDVAHAGLVVCPSVRCDGVSRYIAIEQGKFSGMDVEEAHRDFEGRKTMPPSLTVQARTIERADDESVEDEGTIEGGD